MKTNLLLIAAGIFLMACEPAQVRYTQQSPEIETFKSVLKAYNDRNLEGMNAAYADTAKIFMNSSTKGVLASEENAEGLKGMEIFSSAKFDFADDDIEMVVTDKGETWVNYWGKWQGTFAANNEPAEIALHITARFIDGKIVQEYDYFDSSGVDEKYQEIEAMAKAATDSTATTPAM